MKIENEIFAKLMQAFEPQYNLATVFNDFLTMSICSVTQNPATGKSHYEDLYLETIAKYANDELRFNFPKMFSQLIWEMDLRFFSEGYHNDVLGEFYEENLYKKGAQQFFTPWPICQFMAKSVADESKKNPVDRPLRILEPACGSGRMLLAALKEFGPKQEYYGVDIDPVCVKMTALNMFLNGMFNSEVMCANFLLPDDFRFSYRISMLPFGIFRIDEKEKSPLWHLMQNSLKASMQERANPPDLEDNDEKFRDATQMRLF